MERVRVMGFEPSPEWMRLQTIDAHTAGEPLRMVVAGYPDLPGATMLDKRRYAREHLDHLRRALMHEPRGHADMYGCVLTPPVTPDGDVGVIFMHNEGYSTMCGHGIIALVKIGIEYGLLEGRKDRSVVRIDTPAGRVVASAEFDGRSVERVRFVNVASFVLRQDVELEVARWGAFRCDVAFGGAFYAYVDAAALGLAVSPREYPRLIEAATEVKRAVARAVETVHPAGDPGLNFLYGVILGEKADAPVHSRNVCVFADREVDRSPTGTGVSGRAAILHRRGEIATGEWVTIESLIGTRFDVRVVRTTEIAGMPAVIPEVRGRAFITGRHEFWIDPHDPLAGGVLLR
jgi:trans-L-3-hydroxyproline dehydratase